MPITPELTEQMVTRAAKGDAAAFATLYENFLDPIYRYIFVRVRTPELAEDLTQTVFLKAWQALPKLAEREHSFSSWLYTIARNTVIDHWKKKKDVPINDDNPIWHTVADERPNPHEIAIQGEEAKKALLLLDVLTNEQRELITLRFIEDKTTEEIATLMNRRPDAIRALQYRALKALREEQNKPTP